MPKTEDDLEWLQQRIYDNLDKIRSLDSRSNGVEFESDGRGWLFVVSFRPKGRDLAESLKMAVDGSRDQSYMNLEDFGEVDGELGSLVENAETAVTDACLDEDFKVHDLDLAGVPGYGNDDYDAQVRVLVS